MAVSDPLEPEELFQRANGIINILLRGAMGAIENALVSVENITRRKKKK